jgi:hypothetical protein
MWFGQIEHDSKKRLLRYLILFQAGIPPDVEDVLLKEF